MHEVINFSLSEIHQDIKKTGLVLAGLLLSLGGTFAFNHTEIRALCLIASAMLFFPFMGKLTLNSLNNFFRIYGYYLLLCISSVFWSIYWQKSLGKVLEMTFAYLWIWYALSRGREYLFRLFRCVILFSIIILISSSIAYLLNIEGFRYQYMNSFFGFSTINHPWLGKNGVGLLASMIFLVFYSQFLQTKRLNPILLSFCLLLIALAYSRTSFIALLIGLILFHFSSLKNSLLLVFGSFLIYSYSSDIILNLLYRGQTRGNLLSGRPELWKIAWEEYLRSPWIGYGYGVGSSYATRNVFFFEGISAGTAHNGFLEVLLNLGILGGLLLIPFYFLSSFIIFKKINKRKFCLILSSYPVIFCSTLMNTGISGWFSIPMCIYLIMLAYISLPENEISYCS